MRKRRIAIWAMGIILTLGTAGAYIAVGAHYETHFFEHTTINGIDVSDMTVQEAERLIAEQAEDYRIDIRTKDNTVETIEGSEIGYQFVSRGEVQGFLEKQNIVEWLPACLQGGAQYVMEASVTCDEAKLSERVKRLVCMQTGEADGPKDAYLTRKETGIFEIVPEEEGRQLVLEKVESLVRMGVKNGEKTVDLAAAGCYLKPAVYADDSRLKAEAEAYNRYSSIAVTYQMGGGKMEELDPELVLSWFSLDDKKQPAINREAVAAWVGQLADRYDTIGKCLPFMTSNGETVYPESRTYGWQMDREAETEALYQLLLSGQSAQRSPIWMEGAWSRGENDIGNTYVEIDYTNQRMWYYKDGVLLVNTAVVTGNVSAGTASPEGVFCLVGKEEHATLVGEGYKTPVDYWMPFYGGVGIHDADSWRSTYGGDIYMWSGSHGCINTPTAQAAIIYQNIAVGTPIVCYSSATNYGYGQTDTGGASAGGTTAIGGASANGTITIDGESQENPNFGGTDPGIIDIGSTDAGTTDTGGSGGTGGATQPGAEFPITIQDEWSGGSGTGNGNSSGTGSGGTGNGEMMIW